MKRVDIYTNDAQKKPTYSFHSPLTKEEIVAEIFKCKIFACQFNNRFIAINTEKILFLEIID